MSAILKACLSILNGKDEARMDMAKFWGAIFPRIGNQYVALLFTSGTWVEASKAGCWDSWKIETPSADLQFNDVQLFQEGVVKCQWGTWYYSDSWLINY